MADENKSKDVLVHADHVKVYFKGKDKKSGTVRAVDDISSVSYTHLTLPTILLV